MQCPNCRDRILTERRLRGIDTCVATCPACGGAWFGAAALESVLRVASKEVGVPADATERKRRLCPECVRSLCAFYYPQTYVEVDMCPKCHGLWLDASEFHEIETVREALARHGRLETYAPPTGLRGALIRFVDAAIEALSPEI